MSQLKRTILLSILISTILALPAADACTIFILPDSNRTLFCNNEDWTNPKTRIWFVPAGEGYYGCAYVGFDDGWAQGGLGYDGQGRLGPVHREVELYDPATDRWKQGPPLPNGVFGAQGADVFDGKIFLIGVSKGERLAGSGISTESYVFDPNAGTWSRTTDLPHNYGSTAVTFHHDRIYVIGGHDEGFKQYSDVYVGVIKKVGLKETTSVPTKSKGRP